MEKSTMRPGQLEPNEFEVAILTRISEAHPSIQPFLRDLHVLSCEYTGVGTFTKFRCEESGPTQHLGLNALISMPHVLNGMGADLVCKAGHPVCLEIFTFGEELWNGLYEGFSMDAATRQSPQPDGSARRRSSVGGRSSVARRLRGTSGRRPPVPAPFN